MKISHFIILLAVIGTLLASQSCGSSIEEKLVGSWVLSKSTIPNFDSVVAVKSQEYVAGAQSALVMANQQYDTCTNPQVRAMLEAKRTELTKIMNDGSPENIRRQFEEQQSLLKGNFQLIFGNESRLSVFIGEEGNRETNTGTWSLKGDTIQTFFDNNPSESLVIKDISSGTLVIESLAIDSYGVNLILEFSKM